MANAKYTKYWSSFFQIKTKKLGKIAASFSLGAIGKVRVIVF